MSEHTIMQHDWHIQCECYMPLATTFPSLAPSSWEHHVESCLLCHAGHFLATSLKTQQLSSCEIFQIPALSARLPWTHAHSHPHRLHPHAASSPNTCCSHLSLTICGRQQWVYTTTHTHTQTCLTIADPAATCPPPTPRPTNQTPTHTAVSLRLVA